MIYHAVDLINGTGGFGGHRSYTDLGTLKQSQEMERQSGNTGRLNRNLYVEFTEQAKTRGMTSKKHCFP